jgi:hypothetical protein
VPTGKKRPIQWKTVGPSLKILAPLHPVANPTIASYNASVVKIYSAVNSKARAFLDKKYFSPI